LVKLFFIVLFPLCLLPGFIQVRQDLLFQIARKKRGRPLVDTCQYKDTGPGRIVYPFLGCFTDRGASCWRPGCAGRMTWTDLRQRCGSGASTISTFAWPGSSGEGSVPGVC